MGTEWRTGCPGKDGLEAVERITGFDTAEALDMFEDLELSSSFTGAVLGVMISLGTVLGVMTGLGGIGVMTGLGGTGTMTGFG